MCIDKEKLIEWVRSGSKGKLNMDHADFRGLSLRGAKLDGLSARWADWTGSIMVSCSFVEADLSNGLINDASWQDTILTDACMADVTARKSNFTGCQKTGVNLDAISNTWASMGLR